MNIGFTGTREGMSDRQRAAFKLLRETFPEGSVFHHGACVGADEQANAMAYVGGISIVIHPPTDIRWMMNMSEMSPKNFVEVLPPKPYGERNQDIVDACDLLIAAPEWLFDGTGGTQWTMELARKAGKPIVILDPQ